MRLFRRFFGAALITLIGTLSASAHPGHGEPGPAHYVTEPTHFVPVVLATAAILCAIVALAAMRKKAATKVRSRKV